ncbi:MAG: flippase-like domain-containing protein, partial [Clostridia bacterium]|nr:flippase-like domain-containing protein [Clostridia bacterium]
TFYTVYAVSKTLSGGSIASLNEVFSAINPTYAVILVAITVLLLFSDALKYAILSKITSGRFSFRLSFKVGVMGRFYDNVTPFNTGGQAYQIYQYYKAGYSSAEATAIPIIKYIFQLVAWIVVSLILYIANRHAIDYLPASQEAAVRTLTYAGIAIASAAPILVILFSLFPKPVEKVIGFFLRLGQKLKIVKDYDKTHGKISSFLDGYKRAFVQIAKNVGGAISLFLVCCLDFLLVMSVPFFVILALGKTAPSAHLLFDVITLNAHSLFAASLVPTPGNSGAIEGIASMAFSPIHMAGGTLFWLVFIWRVCTYYIYIILGLFGTAVTFISNHRDKYLLKKQLAAAQSESPRKIRVLQVLDNYFPTVDGVVNVVDNYARLLNEKFGDELKCDVLVPRYPNAPEPDGYDVIQTTSVSGGKFGVRLPLPALDRKLKKYLRKNRYDLVHCHSPVTLSRTALKYCSRYKVPIVFTVHTMYHEEINRSVGLSCIQRFALNFLLDSIKQMDYLWATTEHCKNSVRKLYKIDLPCDVVPNGTDMYDLDGAETDAAASEIRDRLRITDDERVLLFVGRLVVVKNVSMTIKTAALLKQRGIKIRLIIVGDGDYKDTLVKECEELKVDDITTFVGRITDRAELAAYYKLADYYLIPSTFDTAPLATREAEALGTPCMMVEGSSASEGVTDCENGFLAEKTAEAWADKIEFVESNPEIYQAVAQNCKSLAPSWEEVITTVYEKYKDIIALEKPDRKMKNDNP